MGCVTPFLILAHVLSPFMRVLGDYLMRALLVIFLLTFLDGCATSKTMDEEVEEMRKEALSELDVYGCIMQGKVVAAVGMFGTPACIELYSDGGKKCDDSSQCQGTCITREVIENGTHTSGICQGSGIDVFGCYNTINDGVAGPGVCVD